MSYLFDDLNMLQRILTLSPLGLITDVDGTVSRIAASPSEARVHPECREHLADLASKLDLVAAVSGRPVLDVKEMVGVDGVVYIGNHGLERWQDGKVMYVEGVAQYVAKVGSARDELGSRLSIKGLCLEDKGVALSVHYRNAPDTEQARRAILEAIANSSSASDFKILEGKMVVELRPPVDVNKGTAVKALIEDYSLRGGIYLGDDMSDLDAFKVMRRQGFAAIGVVGEETPVEVEASVDLTLNGVGDVARFLKWLAEAVSR